MNPLPWIRLAELLRRSALLLALSLGAAGGSASAQTSPPAPKPDAPKSDTPKPDDSKPEKPVVLDPATVLKLREVAFDAAREGDLKTLAEFFRVGQPADITNARGDTLLILAAYYGHDEAVKLILSQPQAPINARNKMGFNALTGASYKGYLGIVRQLADRKADLNNANERGQTALMFAAMFGRTEVVRFLVEQKVDLKAKDDAGKTALDLAKFQGNTEVVALLTAAEQPAKPPIE